MSHEDPLGAWKGSLLSADNKKTRRAVISLGISSINWATRKKSSLSLPRPNKLGDFKNDKHPPGDVKSGGQDKLQVVLVKSLSQSVAVGTALIGVGVGGRSGVGWCRGGGGEGC